MMGLEERSSKILELLSAREGASVAELSEYFRVSSVTIRNDLNQLAELGRVVRTHGGARISSDRTRQEISFATRQRTNATEKRLIGQVAAQLVNPNEAILLDASTTAVAVAQALNRRTDLTDVTVVTTGIFTALDLLGNAELNIVLSGGYVRSITGSITGLVTSEVLSRFNFHKAFLGAWGITPTDGMMDTAIVEVELKQLIVPRCQEVIAIVDGTKFGRVATASFANAQQITRIITDSSAPDNMLEVFRRHGVEVIVATEEGS